LRIKNEEAPSEEEGTLRDAYNFFLVDHLVFTMGVGGFLLRLATGSPRKSKPRSVEVYERIGRAFADKSIV